MVEDVQMNQRRRVERVLFVCTANICRSPMAEVLLRSELEKGFPEVQVSSAGFLSEGTPAHKKSVWAMTKLGLDLSGHGSRRVMAALQDQPDLILTMAREHLRSLAEIDPEIIERAFTLKEFVQLADLEGRRRAGEGMADYVKRVRAGRKISALSSPSRENDIEDPIGRRKAAFSECASELRALIESLSTLLYPSKP